MGLIADVIGWFGQTEAHSLKGAFIVWLVMQALSLLWLVKPKAAFTNRA